MSYTLLFAGLVLVLAVNYTSADNADAVSTPNEMYCPDLRPQRLLELEQTMGKWYVVEVIKHKIDPVHATPSGHIILETCPVVHLRFSSPTSLRLLWTEKAGNLDYSFIIPDIGGAPGFWMSRGLQNGTLLNRNYVQFIGTVQVMKAIASHMVLTFCAKTSDNQMYSILLSRKSTLPQTDSTGVRDLLSIRGLTIASVQETCANSASRKDSSNVTRWIQILFSTLTVSFLATTACTSTSWAGF